MSQLFVWDPLVPLLVSLGPYGYPHWCMGGIHLHTYRCHMGVIGVPEVKKSIFPLWSGIALGWLKWPKNTPKRSKMRIFGFRGPTRGHAGCPPCVHCGYRGRIFAVIPSFIGSERASNGVWALARILHLFFILDLSPSLDHPLLKRHPYHINRYLGCQTIAGVKKSIFPLWSGIALGWSKWPKNTPKRPKI